MADYYQSTVLYYTYLETGDTAKQKKMQTEREDAASRMGALGDCAGEIDALFTDYMAAH